MKLAIFGATGKTGRALVEQASAAGHAVTALVRDPAKLPWPRGQLTVVPGDVRDAAQVSAAVAGQQAVLSALGQTRPPTARLLTAAATHILQAMQQHGVRRFIYLTGAAVRAAGDSPSVVRSAIVTLMRLVAREALEDSERAFKIIQASSVDWVVVRAPILGDGPSNGAARATFTPPGPARVTRSDVAAFMLRQLTDPAYVRRAPMLAASRD